MSENNESRLFLDLYFYATARKSTRTIITEELLHLYHVFYVKYHLKKF